MKKVHLYQAFEMLGVSKKRYDVADYRYLKNGITHTAM